MPDICNICIGLSTNFLSGSLYFVLKLLVDLEFMRDFALQWWSWKHQTSQCYIVIFDISVSFVFCFGIQHTLSGYW